MAEVGRPLKFKSVEELQEKIDGYFESCFEMKWVDEDMRDEYGEFVYTKKGKKKQTHKLERKQTKPFKITDLALALGTTRDLLCDYEDKDEFSDAIKKAKLMVEGDYENRLINRGNSGDIFALKNFNWKDRSETDLTSGNKPIPVLGLELNNNANVLPNNRSSEDTEID